MRFLVLGAGGLGGFFGGKLLKGGADVTFLVRPGRAAQLQRDGLIVRSHDGEIRAPVTTIQQGQIDGIYDVVLLCCKAYDLDGAISAISPAMGPQSAVMPLLNGIRHYDVLQQQFGAPRVLGGLTIINAALMPDGAIEQGELRINTTALGELDGGQSARCGAIKSALEAGGIAVDMSNDITAALWAKFFVFACIAVTATLTRSRAGAIARSAAGADFVSAVIDECARIVTAEGYAPPPDYPTMIRKVFSEPTSPYGPSLLVDMEEGRTTEGEHTIGDLVRRAARHGVSAPVFSAALCNIQAYEINRTAAQGQPRTSK
jgi:2-dehydropantoate 2-reductase